jgi:hypothetical protein
MMTSFDIRFEIPEEEWLQAIARRHESTVETLFDLFYGNVVIEMDGQSLLGPPYNISVADLACGIATILQSGFPIRASSAKFRQGDDSLEIDFAVDRDRVLVSSEGRQFWIGKDVFLSGARSFVREFARQLCERIPDFARWKDLRILMLLARTSLPN